MKSLVVKSEGTIFLSFKQGSLCTKKIWLFIWIKKKKKINYSLNGFSYIQLFEFDIKKIFTGFWTMALGGDKPPANSKKKKIAKNVLKFQLLLNMINDYFSSPSSFGSCVLIANNWIIPGMLWENVQFSYFARQQRRRVEKTLFVSFVHTTMTNSNLKTKFKKNFYSIYVPRRWKFGLFQPIFVQRVLGVS